jgi:hypothetical protein
VTLRKQLNIHGLRYCATCDRASAEVGVELDLHWASNSGGQVLNHTLQSIPSPTKTRRRVERTSVRVPGRVTWRDSRGMTRFASVVTRDISAEGVYLECRGSQAIPLHRLVYLQLERDAREQGGLPQALTDGRVLSAIYRVGPCEPTTGTPSGYALRLLLDPGNFRTAAAQQPAARSIA